MGLFDDFSGNFASLLNQPNTTQNNSYAGQVQSLLQQFGQQKPQQTQQTTQAPATQMQTGQLQTQSPAPQMQTGTYANAPSVTPTVANGGLMPTQGQAPFLTFVQTMMNANPDFRKLTGQS